MTIDLLVAMDMNDKISEATNNAKKKFDGKSMASRLKQRRQQRQLLNDNETVSLLSGLGLPIQRSE